MSGCPKSHAATIPALGVSVESSDALVLDEGDAGSQWVEGARILELDLDRPELVDLRFDECDLSGVVAKDFVMRRVAMRRTRLRGVSFANGQYDDGLLEDCTTDELSMRFTRLRNVTFRRCDLSGADFYSAIFEHVTLDSCSLRGARFNAATVKCLEISGCDMTGLTGAHDLKGAVMSLDDLQTLAPSLAREAGIELTD